MKYIEKVQIYNKYTKHYTRPMPQTDENIIYFSPYPKSVNMENHNKTCPTVSSANVRQNKILYPVQVTITVKKRSEKD